MAELAKMSSGNDFGSNLIWEQKNKDVFQYYDLVETIGEGSISKIDKIVKKDVGGSADIDVDAEERASCWDCLRCGRPKSVKKKQGAERERQAYYALKTIDLRLVNDEFLEELRNEIGVFRTLDHPNIVKAYETYGRRKSICIVMELCTGGDLYERNPYTEKESATIVGKLLSAVSYMHHRGIVHRDLKFENIMFESRKKGAEVKVIDFGLSAKYINPRQNFSERVGTVYTMAPQVIQGKYNAKADVWSIGVIAYMLLTGTKPFWGTKRRIIISKILANQLRFDGEEWEHVSPEGKAFVQKLLTFEEDERPEAKTAQQHAWLRDHFRLSDRRPSLSVETSVRANILQYAESSEFKRLALNVIAYKSTPDEISRLRKVFDQYDQDNDGFITFQDFKAALSSTNLTEEELGRIFNSLDVNKEGTVYYTEFLAAAIEAQGRIEESRLADAFHRLDSDDTGYISKENLLSILGSNTTVRDAEALIQEVDADNDGRISYDEFCKVFMEQKNREMKEVYEAGPTRKDD